MFGIGLISLLQVWFLPGLCLLVFSKKLKFIDKLLLSLPLSITINYILIFFLVLLKSYNQITLSILIFIETFIIIFFSKNNIDTTNTIMKFLSLIETKKFKFNIDFIDVIIALIFLIYLFLAIANIGNVIGIGDPITYYNWTLSIIDNKIPTNTYDYPLGAAILNSISFVLLNIYR